MYDSNFAEWTPRQGLVVLGHTDEPRFTWCVNAHDAASVPTGEH
jgi:hypothetical protein